ncbi:MAG: hypothetical protein LBG44_07925 [Gemmatimonadota bacterium]|nr:hypothetical protein [Gemmatimonadota bacterium]
MIEDLYTAAVSLAGVLLPALSIGQGKLARGIRGRRGAVERLEAWAAGSRNRSRPLAWFHAPSVGEGLQARAVIETLRELEPEMQIVYTWFSPSAESFARTIPADVADYLPLDLPGLVRRLFDALQPDVIAFTKTEIWPNITREAERRGVPVVLLSATLPAASSRLRGPARALLTPSHQRLSRVAAISAADGGRFEALGVPPDRITVMGDARFDQVWRRVKQPLSDPALIELLTGSLKAPGDTTLVAGSTWPEDEERLIPALAALNDPCIRLVIAPHEPTEAYLTGLSGRLRAAGLSFAFLGDEAGVLARPRVVVVDRTGVLGDLYRLADIAYVGGGFGHDGLHSVLEPAAFGAPVIFGPNHDNSREAGELVLEEGARSVRDQKELEKLLTEWTRAPETRAEAGRTAGRYVEVGLGAARRGARVLADIAGDHRSPLRVPNTSMPM